MTIKHILFDLGGVLVPDCTSLLHEDLAGFLDIDRVDLDMQVEKIRPHVFSGELSLYELYCLVLENYEIRLDPQILVDKHISIYKNNYRLDAYIVKLIEELKSDYTVSCLTNTEIEIAKLNIEYGLYDIFDNAFLSTELGMCKPQREIYEAVLNSLAALPEEVIFIDDNRVNVDMGDKLGMKSILFLDKSQLKEILSLI